MQHHRKILILYDLYPRKACEKLSEKCIFQNTFPAENIRTKHGYYFQLHSQSFYTFQIFITLLTFFTVGTERNQKRKICFFG